jgi:hypothetical protein
VIARTQTNHHQVDQKLNNNKKTTSELLSYSKDSNINIASETCHATKNKSLELQGENIGTIF